MIESIDAVVMAGTGKWDKQEFGKNKCLLELENKSVIECVLSALEESSKIKKYVIVGPYKELLFLKNKNYSKLEGILPEQPEGYIRNAELGIDFLNSNNKTLMVMNGDSPLVRHQHIDYIVDHYDKNLDFAAVFVDREYVGPYEEYFPRPFSRLVELQMRGGNIFMMNPAKIKNKKVLEFTFSVRKLRYLVNTLSTALYGIGYAAHYPLCIARISSALAALQFDKMKYPKFAQEITCLRRKDLPYYGSKILKCNADIMLVPFGSITTDIDEKNDYDVVKEHFKELKEHADYEILNINKSS